MNIIEQFAQKLLGQPSSSQPAQPAYQQSLLTQPGQQDNPYLQKLAGDIKPLPKPPVFNPQPQNQLNQTLQYPLNALKGIANTGNEIGKFVMNNAGAIAGPGIGAIASVLPKYNPPQFTSQNPQQQAVIKGGELGPTTAIGALTGSLPAYLSQAAIGGGISGILAKLEGQPVLPAAASGAESMYKAAPAIQAITGVTNPYIKKLVSGIKAESPLIQNFAQRATSGLSTAVEGLPISKSLGMNPLANVPLDIARGFLFPNAGPAESNLKLSETPVVQTAGIGQLVSHEGAPSEERVSYYLKKILNGERVDPLLVVKEADGKWGIEDGKHRYEAFKQAGFTNVPVVTMPDPANKEAFRAALRNLDMYTRGGMAQGIVGNEARQAPTAGSTEALNQMDFTPPPAEPPVQAPPPAEGSGKLPAKDAARNALYASSAIKTAIEQRTQAAFHDVQSGVKANEQELFRRAIEHPEENIRGSNPGKFQQAVDSFNKFTDSLFKIYNANVTTNRDKIGFVEDFYSHIVDLKDPIIQEKFDKFALEKMTGNPQGWFTKDRLFDNIDELRAAGFELKNKSVAQDILEYGKGVAKSTARNAFYNTLRETNPMDVNKGEIPIKFKQVYNNVSVSPDVYEHVKNSFGENQLGQNRAVKAYSALNQIDKSLKLGLGMFHSLKTTIRAFSTTPTSIPRAVVNMLSEDARNSYLQEKISSGAVDAAGKFGITLGQGSDVTADSSVLKKLASNNPIEKASSSMFDGLIKTYKIDLAESMMKKFDVNSPVQLEQARKLGAEVNNLFGGLNYEVLNRNKSFQTALKALALAPDFNEGKLRQLLTAIDVRSADPAHTFARKAIIGEALTVGILAELGRRLTTGKFDTNLADLVQNAVIDPNIPLPPQFNNPTTGKSQVAGLPGSTITDIARTIQNPGQALQTRGAALPALISKATTNKDYYGQQVYNPTDSLAAKTIKVLKSEAPIPVVQAQKVNAGKETLGAGILNVAGLRVKTNPNDPLQVQQMAYINAQKEATKNLDQNEMAVWNTIHPQKKDIDGNIIFTPGVANTQQKAVVYLNNPKLMDAEIAINQKLPVGQQNPLWNLPKDKRALILAAQASLPGEKNLEKTALSKAAWYPQYLQQQSQFFNNISAQTSAATPPPANPSALPPRPQPTPYQSQQMAAKNWKDPQVQSYLKLNTTYNDQLRGQLGLPALAAIGGAGSSFKPRQRFTGGGKIKTAKYTSKKIKVGSLKVPKIRILSSRGGHGTKVKLTTPPRISLAHRAGTKKIKLRGVA